MRRRVAVLTGSRAEYGLLRGVMAALAHERGVELQVLVCGMHLLKPFGLTVREVEADGWPIIGRVRMQTGDDSPLDGALGLSRGVAGIAEALHRAKSSLLVVLGDRVEAMAGALAATMLRLPLAHIHGGDVAPGDVDDSLRHAITKLATHHFAASQAAARRIRRLGEDAWRIHFVGAPGLDRLRELMEGGERAARTIDSDSRKAELRQGAASRRSMGAAAKVASASRRASSHAGSRTRVERREALVVFHPTGRSPQRERAAMQAILSAVQRAGLRSLIVYPNTDGGSTGIVEAIRSHARRHARDVRVVRSLPRDAFLQALRSAAVLVGNSSAGIIEAPLAGTASVNVGDRQAGRELGGPSVISCSENSAAILRAIRAALGRQRRIPRRTPYGDGRAAARIARLCATLPLGRDIVRKRLAY